MADEYYNIGPSLRGYDFYTGDESNIDTIYIDVSQTVSAQTIALASSSLDFGTVVVVIGAEIQNAQSSLSIEVDLVSEATRIVNASASLDSDVSQSVSAQRLATIISAQSIESDLAVLVNKTTSASSITSVESSLTAVSRKITSATPNLMEITVDAIAAWIDFVGIDINISSSVLVEVLRFSPGFVDSSSIITLMILDDKPITNHGRTLNSSISPVFTQNENWNNRKSRYYRRSGNGGKRTFSVNWEMLPNYRNKTVDNRYARDFISSVANDPDVHVLKIINQDTSGLTPPTETTHYVYVANYSESLVRRDLVDDVYYFNCDLVLEEA
jgi:DNA-dependent RNA polymerase auxiliary subunit epsilon